MSKKKAPRKKVPKTLAVINADNCTGCESCREVCPVDCIDLNQIGLGTKAVSYTHLTLPTIYSV